MDVQDLRYIVFVLDSTVDQHDGKVFRSISDAKEFCNDCINDHYGSKFIIGSFVNNDHEEMNISYIESFGLKTSVKKLTQLDIFKYNKHNP